jgi:hypothetical protein
MVSEAKIAANRRNATKSCGPKTEAGRNITRFNAVKHGMTAEIALLPVEDAAVFEEQQRDWFEIYKPRNGMEAAKVERSFYLWWQLGRITRAQSAQLCEKARTAEGERLASEARETIELSIQLFLPGPEGRWGASENSKRAGERDKVTGSRDRGFEHPALIESRLGELEDGCRWLYGQWKEEAAILEAGKTWGAIECFKAVRLMGMQPLSVIDLTELADFLRPCVALAGRGIELARETWALLAPPNAERGWEVLRGQLEPDDALPISAEAARESLRETVEEQIGRLAEKIEEHERLAEAHGELAPQLHAFDWSPLAERTRRYERACQRTVDRIDRELETRSWRSPAQFAPAYTAYRGPTLSQLRAMRARRMAAGAIGDDDDDVARRRNEANAHDEVDPMMKFVDDGRTHVGGATGDSLERDESMMSCDGTAAGRNEANEHERTVQSPRRNEANGTEEASVATIDEFERSDVAGGPRGDGGDGIASEERSGATPHQSTGLECETQAEVVERRQVGSATVTRFSLAAGVKGSRADSRRERRARRRAMRQRNR